MTDDFAGRADAVAPARRERVSQTPRARASQTPRDRAVDALRAFAILGVVLGHWLVTAVVADSGTLRVTSPLKYLPHLTPVSWLLQTMAVFFFVGGRMAVESRGRARDRGAGHGRWAAARMTRLFRPIAPLLGVWSAAAVAMLAWGADPGTVYALVKLVWSPMWFLLVFAALTAATPLVTRLHPVWPLAAVAVADLVRFGLDGPSWVGWINLGTGWLVPYCLGVLWAGGRLDGRVTRWALLLGGAAATTGLVLWAGYPASMVGVPGAPVSNQAPPTLAAVTFGLSQCGAALVLSGPLRRVLRRPAAWALVTTANLAAMTIFLWHQTALIAVTATALRVADRALPGLHTAPVDPGWVAVRLAWLPVFATVLAVCLAVFRGHEARHHAPKDEGPFRGCRRERRAGGCA
ncbi:acyltransferase [Microbispora sp. NPDC049633]|uniref:acyltransferase family protein n=1 Tax=Microbispora sp. NPDC049633 TaxID=3154355 RepID=UPI00343CC752